MKHITLSLMSLLIATSLTAAEPDAESYEELKTIYAKDFAYTKKWKAEAQDREPSRQGLYCHFLNYCVASNRNDLTTKEIQQIEKYQSIYRKRFVTGDKLRPKFNKRFGKGQHKQLKSITINQNNLNYGNSQEPIKIESNGLMIRDNHVANFDKFITELSKQSYRRGYDRGYEAGFEKGWNDTINALSN